MLLLSPAAAAAAETGAGNLQYLSYQIDRSNAFAAVPITTCPSLPPTDLLP
jgi:hypothetical protein